VHRAAIETVRLPDEMSYLPVHRTRAFSASKLPPANRSDVALPFNVSPREVTIATGAVTLHPPKARAAHTTIQRISSSPSVAPSAK
jgi:hypothetical protein